MEIWREVAVWFLLFIAYSFFGWMMEMISTVVFRHKFYNRGFLIGPLCPIYGVTGFLVTLTVGQQENILEIFCVVMIMGGIIEYLTSYIMEKLFHARWWDYSNRPFNLNGRIYLPTLLAFGALGVIAVKIVSPFLLKVLHLLNDATIISLALAMATILLFDFIISLNLIIRFRATAKSMRGDMTEEITEYIRATFSERGRLNRRLLRAFPAMKVKRPATKKQKKTPRRTRKSRPKSV